MLEERGIKKGVEVFVTDDNNPSSPPRKAVVVNIYPKPSRWLVVKYETGDYGQVEEKHVTTMYEKNRGAFY